MNQRDADEFDELRARTSETNPIEVNFLPPGLLDGSGRLGMTLAPGKKTWSEYGPPWNRDLNMDLARLRDFYNTRTLICLLEDEEMKALQIPDLVARAKEFGMRVLRFPVRDASVPPLSAIPEYRDLAREGLAAVRVSDTVVVHCRGGLGRAGTFAACSLVEAGVSPEDAITIVRAARLGAIETTEQENFVRRF